MAALSKGCRAFSLADRCRPSVLVYTGMCEHERTWWRFDVCVRSMPERASECARRQCQSRPTANDNERWRRRQRGNPGGERWRRALDATQTWGQRESKRVFASPCIRMRGTRGLGRVTEWSRLPLDWANGRIHPKVSHVEFMHMYVILILIVVY